VARENHTRGMICSSWPPTEKAQQKRKRAGQANSNIGNNVAISKSRVLKRMTKNDSVLHKHIKWLKELQEERRLHEEKKEIEQKAKLERKRLFMEREAKKRVAGSQLSDEPEPKHYPLLGKDMDDLTVASSIASTPVESKTKKPAWCRSEEMAEMEDEANLLDFVSGLDFDAYNEDLELQSLMGQLKARIKKLKHEKKKQEIKLQTCVDVRQIFFHFFSDMSVKFSVTCCCCFIYYKTERERFATSKACRRRASC